MLHVFLFTSFVYLLDFVFLLFKVDSLFSYLPILINLLHFQLSLFSLETFIKYKYRSFQFELIGLLNLLQKHYLQFLYFRIVNYTLEQLLIIIEFLEVDIEVLFQLIYVSLLAIFKIERLPLIILLIVQSPC